MRITAFPAIEDDLLEAHATAHGNLATAFGSSPPEVRAIFMHLQRRLNHEGLAYVQSVSTRVDAQLLLPPPRAFLTRTQQLRLRGAAAAFRHIDTRVTLEQRGDVPSAIHSSTLQALHALFEGANPGDHESNPGMFRVTSTSWQKAINPFEHPNHADVPGLVDEVLEMARDRSVPAVARAAWLTFTMLSIHPFVDGNGRTCRSLYLLVASPELPLALDWGILEQWSVTRHAYIATLQAGNKIQRYDASKMTAEPFATYSTIASTRGAEVCLERLAELGRGYEDHRRRGLSGEAAVIAEVIRCERSCTWDELRATGLHVTQLDDAVTELISRGAIRWTPRPASRRTMEDPARQALTLAG